ncbi:MAG: LPS export ABC transporter periplasmic protein LptC [Ignavibacteriae bacterium HGW-Ignavibacteriae-3]|nr:MAG: LPS export ABC transporter periplasmic protein LptC [Ignavibacteriae bacterium HGW-Ignavibacteriae-3]
MKIIFPVFILLILVSSCSEEKIQPQIEKSSVQGEIPSNESWNSKILFTEEGRLKAILYSDHFKMFDIQKITLLDGVKIKFYNSEQRNTSWLTSLRGKVNDITRDMYAMDSVVAQNDSGTVLKTTELMWRNADQKIVTDKFVTITSPQEIIQGYGMESDQALENYKIFNVTYTKKKTGAK